MELKAICTHFGIVVVQFITHGLSFGKDSGRETGTARNLEFRMFKWPAVGH